jgi:sec-independent protein translocase protein TatB
VFGLSFGEIVVLVLLAIVVVGPRQLPDMMRTAGRALTRLRRLVFDMRSQSGIDEILRSEGLDRDIEQFRSLVKGNVLQTISADLDAEIERAGTPRAVPEALDAGGATATVQGLAGAAREYPLAGVDASGAKSEDIDPYRPAGEPSEPAP